MGLLFSSCHKDKKSEYSHPDYFDNIFAKAELMSDAAPAQALLFVDSAFRRFDETGVKDLYRKYLFKATCNIEALGKRELGLLYVDSMLYAIREKEGDPEFAEDRARALFKRAEILEVQKNYKEAFANSSKGLEILEGIRSLKDSSLLSTYNCMLFTISYKQGNYLDAARFGALALKELLSSGNSYRNFKKIQAKYNDIGCSYSRCGKQDSALFYFNHGLQYLDENKVRYADVKFAPIFVEVAKGVMYGNIGDVYLKLGDTGKGEEFYKRDVRINSQRKFDHGDAQCTQLKIAALYFAQKKLPEAIAEMRSIRTSLDSFHNIENELKWHKLHLDYLENSGKYDEYARYVRPYCKLKDSLAKANPVPRVDIKDEYENIKSHYNMALIQKKDTQKTYFLLIVVICSVVALGIAVMLWLNWKKSKRLNEQILKQNDEMQLTLTSLTESHKQNSTLMQVVAHDLRSPISSMIAITEHLMSYGELPDDDKELLQLMHTSGSHSLEMITDLLNMNTVAEGMEKQPVDMHTLLSYCVDLLQFKANEKEQKIALQVEEITMMVNREKIWRVISNLIVNAIKFSPTGAAINVIGKKEAESYIIEVQDNGIGIPQDLQGKIFDMFTEAKRPGTSGEKPFGLGLAISRQIVEAHNGKIWVRSQPGEGTTFFVSIPITYKKRNDTIGEPFWRKG
ncbi:tetratricopeptide repeat-containing sensor histidine kinase [Flavipsychrobacter stenotrophus]|nr:HAMP domain-containing sensor histidine kinase [Flavipsychrobacter stenotrophus]